MDTETPPMRGIDESLNDYRLRLHGWVVARMRSQRVKLIAATVMFAVLLSLVLVRIHG